MTIEGKDLSRNFIFYGLIIQLFTALMFGKGLLQRVHTDSDDYKSNKAEKQQKRLNQFK